ncbi:hypothetical protein AMTRI_Chr11g157550 [Amborella trichopoda]
MPTNLRPESQPPKSSLPDFHASQSRLRYLDLSENGLTGEIHASLFSLNGSPPTCSVAPFTLILSSEGWKIFPILTSQESALEAHTMDSINQSFPQLHILKLHSSELSVFPDFLKAQKELREFDNQIQGQISDWLWGLK